MTTFRPALAAVCALTAVAVSACGNKTAPGSTTVSHGSLVSPSPSSRAGKLTTTAVGRTFWYENFKVTVVSAQIGIPAGQPEYDTNPRLILNLTMENVGQDTHEFDANLLAVNEADQNYTSPQPNYQAVPGGQRQDGSVTFTIKPGFKLADAQLIVGSARQEQAFLPLGKVGKTVTLEPLSFAISGNLSAGNMTLTLTGGTIDFSKDYYNDADADHAILVVTYSATHTKDKGQAYVSSNEFFLKLPDGTAIPALDGSSSPALPGGTTKQELAVRFDIKKPVEGSYDLLLKGGFSDDYSSVQGDLPFTVTPGQSSGSAPTAVPSSDALSASPEATPSGH